MNNVFPQYTRMIAFLPALYPLLTVNYSGIWIDYDYTYFLLYLIYPKYISIPPVPPKSDAMFTSTWQTGQPCTGNDVLCKRHRDASNCQVGYFSLDSLIPPFIFIV